MLKVNNLYKKYNNNYVIKDVSFHVKEGENVAIVGESGSGKSTIANIILGFESFNEGGIEYQGKSLKTYGKRDWKNYRKDVQTVFQDAYNSLNPRLKVKDIISEPLINYTRLNKQERYRKVEEILSIVELDKDASEKYPHAFSTGQQKRINIARAIICEPKIVILDEVTSGLDPETKNKMIDLFQELHESKEITFIIITHDISVAQKLASQIIIMKDGKVVEMREEFNDLQNLTSTYAQELINAVPKIKYISG